MELFKFVYTAIYGVMVLLQNGITNFGITAVNTLPSSCDQVPYLGCHRSVSASLASLLVNDSLSGDAILNLVLPAPVAPPPPLPVEGIRATNHLHHPATQTAIPPGFHLIEIAEEESFDDLSAWEETRPVDGAIESWVPPSITGPVYNLFEWVIGCIESTKHGIVRLFSDTCGWIELQIKVGWSQTKSEAKTIWRVAQPKFSWSTLGVIASFALPLFGPMLAEAIKGTCLALIDFAIFLGPYCWGFLEGLCKGMLSNAIDFKNEAFAHWQSGSWSLNVQRGDVHASWFMTRNPSTLCCIFYLVDTIRSYFPPHLDKILRKLNQLLVENSQLKREIKKLKADKAKAEKESKDSKEDFERRVGRLVANVNAFGITGEVPDTYQSAYDQILNDRHLAFLGQQALEKFARTMAKLEEMVDRFRPTLGCSADEQKLKNALRLMVSRLDTLELSTYIATLSKGGDFFLGLARTVKSLNEEIFYPTLITLLDAEGLDIVNKPGTFTSNNALMYRSSGVGDEADFSLPILRRERGPSSRQPIHRTREPKARSSPEQPVIDKNQQVPTSSPASGPTVVAPAEPRSVPSEMVQVRKTIKDLPALPEVDDSDLLEDPVASPASPLSSPLSSPQSTGTPPLASGNGNSATDGSGSARHKCIPSDNIDPALH